MKRLMIIVPCYNEQEVLNQSSEKLLDVLYSMINNSKISENSGILFVNDGSRDNTWEIIKKLHEKNSHFYGLNLAGNVGHQNALIAGIDAVIDICDFSVTIDADLQDDILAIEQMVDYFNNGIDIVYGVRSNRESDSFFKRFTAQSFYKIMKWLGVKTVYNHADFRLMSKRAMEQLLKYKERNLFLRAIVPNIGYSTAEVYYQRKERTAGKSKYPLKKMISFATDGITSFSIKPINFIFGLGVTVVCFSVLAFIYILISYFLGKAISGWPSIMISIWFLGGVQLLSIGIIGQYIGKTYIESKERPRYNIEEFLNHEND